MLGKKKSCTCGLVKGICLYNMPSPHRTGLFLFVATTEHRCRHDCCHRKEMKRQRPWQAAIPSRCASFRVIMFISFLVSSNRSLAFTFTPGTSRFFRSNIVAAGGTTTPAIGADAMGVLSKLLYLQEVHYPVPGSSRHFTRDIAFWLQ